jgi:hypothetical protein
MQHSSSEYEEKALYWARAEPDKGHSGDLPLAQVFATLALAAVQEEVGHIQRAS